jgi:DNA-binding transcriptional regulator YiaG
VDDANILLTKEQTSGHHAPMSHKRPPRREPLHELMRLRRQKYPSMMQRDFAALLGVTRLHLTTVEQGRRAVSLQLALRWLEVLAPEARLDMFGPLPIVEERVRQIKRLQEVSPEFFKAA